MIFLFFLFFTIWRDCTGQRSYRSPTRHKLVTKVAKEQEDFQIPCKLNLFHVVFDILKFPFKNWNLSRPLESLRRNLIYKLGSWYEESFHLKWKFLSDLHISVLWGSAEGKFRHEKTVIPGTAKDSAETLDHAVQYTHRQQDTATSLLCPAEWHGWRHKPNVTGRAAVWTHQVPLHTLTDTYSHILTIYTKT